MIIILTVISIIIIIDLRFFFFLFLTHFILIIIYHNYIGDNDYESASQFILNKFVSLNTSDQKQIYTHFTCATDTNRVKFVMAAVNDILIEANLRESAPI